VSRVRLEHIGLFPRPPYEPSSSPSLDGPESPYQSLKADHAARIEPLDLIPHFEAHCDQKLTSNRISIFSVEMLARNPSCKVGG